MDFVVVLDSGEEKNRRGKNPLKNILLYICFTHPFSMRYFHYPSPLNGGATTRGPRVYKYVG